MEYREYPAPADLARFVRAFWTLEGARQAGAIERLLPDGRIEMAIHLGDPFDRVADSGGRERQAGALFVGQMETPVVLEPAGRIAVFGVCFHPDGASAFARWPQRETAGRIWTLEDVWGRAAREFVEAVRNASGDA